MVSARELSKQEKADANVVVLCADLSKSTRAEWFQEEFPERFVEMGIAGKTWLQLRRDLRLPEKCRSWQAMPLFSPGRNYEQIRTTIALNQMHVIVCGMHAGVSVGPDGATHQMLEDIGLMRMFANMTVIAPVDAEEARKAVIAAGKATTPIYIRFGCSATPVFTTPETPFQIGKALTLWESAVPKVTLMVTGSLAYEALVAARALDSAGIGSIVLLGANYKTARRRRSSCSSKAHAAHRYY